jgi:hypothetical protein
MQNDIPSYLLDVIKTHHATVQTQPVMTDTSMLTDDERAILERGHNTEWKLHEFKLKHFVGHAQFTPYGKLRQWLIELKSRENTIEHIEYEIQKFEVEEKMALRDADTETDELKKELLLIEAAKIRKDCSRSRLRVSDFYKERNDCIKLIQELLASDEGKLADGRSLMVAIDDPEIGAIHEKEYWTVRMAMQAANDMHSYGRIGAGNFEAILQLPREQQVETIGLANKLTLEYEHRQTVIRDEVARLMNITAPKQGFIGAVGNEFINNMIGSDIETMTAEIKRAQDANNSVDGTPSTKLESENDTRDLNNVYNL